MHMPDSMSKSNKDSTRTNIYTFYIYLSTTCKPKCDNLKFYSKPFTSRTHFNG